jgi:hypothetical protein
MNCRIETSTRVVIQIARCDSAKAWALLVRHSPGMALPNRTFFVSQSAVRALQVAGVRFTQIARER